MMITFTLRLVCTSAQWRFPTALLIALFLVTVPNAAARTWQEGVAAELSNDIGSMSYRYYLPENYSPSESYPLILFLHGNGAQGSNNTSQVSSHISGLVDQTHRDYPAVLVAPQALSNSNWQSLDTFQLTEDIMERMLADFSVDTDRLYLTGLSMGGFGTIDYLYYYANIDPSPYTFAAAIPMSAGFRSVRDLSDVPPFNDTPVWFMHGDRDSAVPVDFSRNAFRSSTGLSESEPIDFNATAFNHPTAINDYIRYTEVVGQGHDIWGPIYANKELYDWMFSQSLTVPEPRSSGLLLLGLLCLNRAMGRSAKRTEE